MNLAGADGKAHILEHAYAAERLADAMRSHDLRLHSTSPMGERQFLETFQKVKCD